MYLKEHLSPLFENLVELNRTSSEVPGEPDLAIVSRELLDAIADQTRALRDLKLSLRLGMHHHGNGESCYLFMLPEGEEMNEDDFERNLEEDYEPDRDETLTIERIDPPTLIEGTIKPTMRIF